jgi:hypothetical protein
MKKLMYNKLMESSNNGELLEIYTEKNNPNECAVGFIIILSENELILNAIDPKGLDDGFLAIRNDDIYSISYDTNYLRKISLLSENEKPRLPKQNIKEYLKEANMFFSIFKESMDNKKLITLKLYYDIDVSGIIKSFDEEIIEISVIDTHGNFDGNSCIYIADVEWISFESINENKLSKLLAINGR